jgi:hypothetical protein
MMYKPNPDQVELVSRARHYYKFHKTRVSRNTWERIALERPASYLHELIHEEAKYRLRRNVYNHSGWEHVPYTSSFYVERLAVGNLPKQTRKILAETPQEPMECSFGFSLLKRKPKQPFLVPKNQLGNTPPPEEPRDTVPDRLPRPCMLCRLRIKRTGSDPCFPGELVVCPGRQVHNPKIMSVVEYHEALSKEIRKIAPVPQLGLSDFLSGDLYKRVANLAIQQGLSDAEANMSTPNVNFIMMCVVDVINSICYLWLSLQSDSSMATPMMLLNVAGMILKICQLMGVDIISTAAGR